MYYAVIMGAVCMFGVQFLFNSRYQRAAGSSIRTSMFSLCGTSLVGLFALLLINRFSLTVTRFNLTLATIAAISALIEVVCVIYAIGKINLSLYSVFSMVGGMALPFLFGIFYLREGMTFAKAICLVLICVGIAFTIRPGEKTRFWIFYVGVFIFNGLNGIYSQIFAASDKPKGVAGDYSILSAGIKMLLALLFLLLIGLVASIRTRKASREPASGEPAPEPERPQGTLALFRKAVVLPLIAVGVLNSIANYLLLISLDHVPGTMQYPLVTGGVMIISTLLGFLTDKKPGKKDILAVTFCFLGMLAFLLPF